jgi:hypothetical protein
MSEKNQIVVVLIVALFLGAFVDRITALKIVVEWLCCGRCRTSQRFSSVSGSCSRSHQEGFRFGSTAEAQQLLGPLRAVMSLAKLDRVERPILTK